MFNSGMGICFSNRTKMLVRRKELAAHPVHVVLLRVSVSYWLCISENGHTLVDMNHNKR